MKALLIVILAGAVSGGNRYFSTESEEVDSMEHGAVPGKTGTSCRCGWSNKGGKRIVGGRETERNEYPFVVSIAMDARRNQFCGGAIVSPWHVITAYHCFWDYTKENITERMMVIAGEHDRTSKQHRKLTEYYTIEKWYPHPEYSKIAGYGSKNDIVILQVNREIRYNEIIGPVCLPKGPLDLRKEYVREMGWGLLSDQGPSSNVLMKVDERVTDMVHCYNEYPKILPEEKLLCTFATDKSTCVGDSGGPLVWVDPETNMYTLVGLVSYGRKCGGSSPSVNVDLSRHVDWIHRTIRDTKPAETCSKL